MRADLTAGDAGRPTVIVHAHEQPRWLELALWGLSVQTHRDFELVVADDGSGPATRESIERFEQAAGRAVLHVWHEDRGARTSEVLNRALLASAGDYVIFLDAGCIARADLVATHVRLARRGAWVAGGAIAPGTAVSERVTVDDVVTGRAFDRRWLQPRAWHQRAAAGRLARGAVAGAVRDDVSRTPARFDTANVATWRRLLVAANGFDMGMTVGEEDRALGLRLENMGVVGVVARHRAVALRLEHARPHRADDALRENRATLARLRRDRDVRAPRGLAELRSTLGAAGEPVAAPWYQHTALP